MKQFMINTGHFFFRWRDTAFTLIFALGLVIISLPRPAHALLGWYGSVGSDQIFSILGALLAISGITVRALVIGFIYVKRAGEGKRIHADELFRDGLFAHTRNPLYVGNLLVVTGVITTVNLNLYWIFMLPFFVFVYYSIILAEEEFLSKKFGQQYADYMASVNRLFPGHLSKIRASFQGLTFLPVRVIKVEHGSTSLILISLLLANLVKFHYRWGIPFDALSEQVFMLLIGVVVLYLLTAALLKKAGKLEWNNA